MRCAPAPPRRHGNHVCRLKPVPTNCYAVAHASNTAAPDGEPLNRTRREAALRPMRTAPASISASGGGFPEPQSHSVPHNHRAYCGMALSVYAAAPKSNFYRS